MLNIIILLFGIIEVNVADKVHDISNIDSITFHQLNAEIHIVQDGNNFSIFLLLCVKHQILALIVLIFLLAHDERVLVEAELNEGLERLQILGQLTECLNEKLLVILVLHGVNICWSLSDFFQASNHFIVLLDEIGIVGNNNARSIVALRK